MFFLTVLLIRTGRYHDLVLYQRTKQQKQTEVDEKLPLGQRTYDLQISFTIVSI